MKLVVMPAPFDPWRELAEFERASPRLAGACGATAVFVGRMRDFSDDTPVSAMTLEHYPGMTERQLAKIGEAAGNRWRLIELLVVHRVGTILPAEPIVLVAAWSAHRAEAFAACRFLIDELKSRAPFWKHEQTGNGPRWVGP